MTEITTHKIAMATGVAGAYVEIPTDDILFNEGDVTFTWGRSSSFDSLRPGTFSFSLANGDGKYTPDNIATTLPTPLREGMGVCWQLNDRLVAGTIRSMQFVLPDGGLVTSARLRVTCDDMLGNAARHELNGPLADAIVRAGSPYLYYPLDEVAGAPAAVDSSGYGPNLSLALSSISPEFGATEFVVTGTTTLRLSASQQIEGGAVKPITYPANSFGAWGVWCAVEPGAVYYSVPLMVTYFWSSGFFVQIDNAGVVSLEVIGVGGAPSGTSTIRWGIETFFSVDLASSFAAGTWTVTATLYQDGVAVSTNNFTTTTQQIQLVQASVSAGGDLRVAHISHTPVLIHEESAGPVTAGQRLSGIAAVVPEITLDPPPTMSPAILDVQDVTGSDTLSLLDEIMRGEQGGLVSVTTGTLTTPAEALVATARERDRPVDFDLDILEILNAPDFVRALTNTVSEATANGPETSATYRNPDLAPLVGSASTSESVAFRDYTDLYEYASDRVFRGVNKKLPLRSVVVEARSIGVDRWADLLAMRPGHRIHITGLPVTQLGFSTWDGWVVGGEETHTQERSLFTINFQPAWDPAVFDTDRFTAGGELTLTSSITSSATSISVSSSGTLFTTAGGDFPQKIQIDREALTVTAVSGASSPQTFTVTRGATDPETGIATLAAAHDADAEVELAPYTAFDY